MLYWALLSRTGSGIVEKVPRLAELDGCYRNAAATHLSLIWLGKACNENDNDVLRCRGRAHFALVEAERGADDVIGAAGQGSTAASALPQDRLYAPARRRGGLRQRAAVCGPGLRRP